MSNFLQHKSQKALLETIKEYLEQQGYKEALSVLEKEQVAEHSSVISSLFFHLDNGDSQSFFSIWNSIPQDSSQVPEIKNLEFFIRVYFAVFPCHQVNGRQVSKEPTNSKYKKNMDEFKEYLDLQGSSFSKSEEVLSYFALPYIPNPSEHPAFRNIFTTKWLNSLKEKLSVLLGKESYGKPSILQLMYEKYIDSERPTTNANEKQLITQINSLENQIKVLNEENNRIKQKMKKNEENWEECTNELIVLSRDLFKTVEGAKQGKPIPDSLLTSSYNTLKKYDKSISLVIPQDTSPVQLNYAIIIKDLSQLQDDLQICALLQALRWRLTRTTRSVHRENLENFIRFNILCTIKPHDALLDNLLSSTRRVKEFTVRFLNVITSEKSGRVYLLQKDNIVGLLTSILYAEKQDNLLRQNALGVLQKLSLKRSAQLEMIRFDVLDWLMKVLKHDSDNIADYTLEYATALLMNLSLRTLGKDKLSKSPNEVITMLNKFISHDNNQVRTYINGTLYSIFTRKSLKEAGLRHGIEKKLKSLKSKSEENIKRQINFILEQLKQDSNEYPTDDTEEEIEEAPESGSDDDEIIPDDEDMDDLITVPGVLTGENLLRERYEKGKILSAVSSRKDLEESKEIIKVSGSNTKRTDSAKKKITSKVTPAKETDYSNGFKSRDKIPRTPLQFT